LPTWIPAIDGFKPTDGSGKHWIDENSKETGTMAGAQRDAAKSFVETMRPKFARVTTNDVTVNGNLTRTMFVSDGKAEEEEHKIELEPKPIAGGKSSNATLTYSQPAMPKKK